MLSNDAFQPWLFNYASASPPPYWPFHGGLPTSWISDKPTALGTIFKSENMDTQAPLEKQHPHFQTNGAAIHYPASTPPTECQENSNAWEMKIKEMFRPNTSNRKGKLTDTVQWCQEIRRRSSDLAGSSKRKEVLSGSRKHKPGTFPPWSKSLREW
jgi:hypothetical protein